jgi:hypothetical protein
LGFDVDNLEILFRELNDVVDYFFILESTKTHAEGLKRKPMWDNILSKQERFKPFVGKVL